MDEARSLWGSRGAPTVVVLAQVGRKEQLLGFVRGHLHLLRGFRLVAPAAVGDDLREDLDLTVEPVADDGLGREQITAAIVRREIDGLIFFRAPFWIHPSEAEADALLDACDVHGVPVATNLGSAEILLLPFGPDRSGGGPLLAHVTFSDVIDELEALARLSELADSEKRRDLEGLPRRARALPAALRAQFVDEVTSPATEASASS